MVTLTIGETLKVTATFQYSGPGYSGYKVRAAICQKAVWIPILQPMDEILFSETGPLSVPSTPTLTLFTVPAGLPPTGLNIVITSAISPGLYELYAKMIGLPGADLYWYGPLDDIQIIGAQVFQNLAVTYVKL